MSEQGILGDELGELQRRLTILKIGLLLVVGLVTLRLWHLQIREGPYYRDLSQTNLTRSIVLEPARGLIYDRNGVLLANNVPSFSLYVTLEDVKDREDLTRKLMKLVRLDEVRLRKKLSERSTKLVQRKVKDRLTLREAALIESHRLDLPGVMIQAESQRNFPTGLTASHVIGYVGEVSADQLEQADYTDLHQGSIVGQYGVENTYDRFLRGRAGQKLIEADALGHEKRTVSVEKPRAGDDLYLTIDLRLQKLAEELLGDEAGAIVALDPKTGEVLALASRPAFDPNVLSRELTAKQWEEVVQHEGRPLTNRATQGQYPPGSAFGIAPSTDWKQKVRSEQWLPGETISASIGQGYVTVTPIQMASLTATVANNGVPVRPRLVKAVMDRATGRVLELPSVPLSRLSIKPETLAIIQNALAGVVTEGTARSAKSSLVTIAGKTGTAQALSLRLGPEKNIPKKFRDHAWFVSYAPVESPRIAVTILVEHMGHGGSAAAPLAKQMIEAFVKLTPYEPRVVQSESQTGPILTTMRTQETP